MREIWQMTLEEVYRLDYTAEGVFDRTPDRKNPDQDNGIPRRGPEAAQDDTVDLSGAFWEVDAPGGGTP